MSQPTNMPTDESTPALHSDSPGGRLRALREARGLDLERIAAQLHLERRVVEAMEQERYQDLPTPVFVAGYYRNYARLLGIDPNPIVAAYRSLAPTHESSFDQLADSMAQRGSRGDRRWGWLIPVVLIALAAVPASLWWQSRSGSESPSTLSESPPQGGDANIDSSRQTLEETGELTANDTASSTEPSAKPMAAPIDSFGAAVAVPANAIPLRGAEPAVSAPPSTEPAPASESPANASSEPVPPVPAATREVVLEFTGTSWVDVRGADGAIVLNGEMRSGERRTLTGTPPYKLVIGNAAATRLSIGGESFDLQGRAQGNVARFALDPNTPQ